MLYIGDAIRYAVSANLKMVARNRPFDWLLLQCEITRPPYSTRTTLIKNALIYNIDKFFFILIRCMSYNRRNHWYLRQLFNDFGTFMD